MKLLSVLYWVLAVPTGALSLVLLLMTVAGRKLSAATPLWLTLVCATVVLAFLVWAHRVLVVHHRPAWACAIVIASWVAFALTMTVNGLLRQTTWN